MRSCSATRTSSLEITQEGVFSFIRRLTEVTPEILAEYKREAWEILQPELEPWIRDRSGMRKA